MPHFIAEYSGNFGKMPSNEGPTPFGPAEKPQASSVRMKGWWRYMELGAIYVAVGVDTSVLTEALKSLAAKFKFETPVNDSGTDNSVY